VEIDATNMPGFYRLDLSDAIVAAGVRSVALLLQGATDMVPLPLEIDLSAQVDAVRFAGQTVSDPGGEVTIGTNVAQEGSLMALTTAAITGVAEELLTIDWSIVSEPAARSVLNALRFLRNKVTLSGDNVSVKKEDDSTEAWAATVTTDAAAKPITGITPL